MFRVLLILPLLALPLAAFPADEKDPPWKPVLPAKELSPLAERVSAGLKKPVESLAGGKLDDDDRERAVKKVRGLALFLVAAAQTSTDNPQRGPLRNAGLKLDAAVRGSKFADAKTILAALPAAKGFEQPAFAPGALDPAKDREDVVAVLMVQCRLRSLGGLDAIIKEVGNGNTAGLKPDEIARFSYHLAVLMEATRTLPPAKKVGPKDPDMWKRWSADARDAALELAAAKDAAGRMKAARLVESKCSKCHTIFRDN
jgi:hypothetical protein